MKTSDSKTISHIWQLAHLRHYFGHDLATNSIDPENAQLIIDRKGSSTANECEASMKRRPVGAVCPQTRGSISS
jgi:hypothetical protein